MWRESCSSHKPAEDGERNFIGLVFLYFPMTFVHLVTACLIDIWSWSLQLSLNLLSPLILPTASATLCLLWLISPCLFHILPPAVVCLPYAAAETPMPCLLTLSSLSTSSGMGQTLRSTLSDSSIVIDWFILILWTGAVEAREQLSFQNSKWWWAYKGLPLPYILLLTYLRPLHCFELKPKEEKSEPNGPIYNSPSLSLSLISTTPRLYIFFCCWSYCCVYFIIIA